MKEVNMLDFVRDYLDLLSEELEGLCPEYGLTKRQRLWIGFCLMGILSTNTICWKKFERASFGGWMMGALSWMFRHSKINWEWLLVSSTSFLLKKYGIKNGVLVLDETDRERSKNARALYKLGKQKDKKSNGYFNGQNIVFLLLVSGSISIPVGFRFYEVDPRRRAWKKEDGRLRKKGVAKKNRPGEPALNPAYPTINQLGVMLVGAFVEYFPHIGVKAVIADALYGTSEFVEGIRALYPDVQVISQIRRNQKIVVGGQEYSVADYFSKRAPIGKKIVVRGGKKENVYYSSVIARVKSHEKKRLIIALKYEGETQFRFIIASNMTWRVDDVLECFCLRWLIEVFFQDWKMYEGWGQLTKHVGEEGSRRTLILSLLFDHCLLSHPAQTARIKDKLPVYTVGSLRDKLSVQHLLQLFENILAKPDPKQYLEQLVLNVEQLYDLRPSAKHMSGRNIRCFT